MRHTASSGLSSPTLSAVFRAIPERFPATYSNQGSTALQHQLQGCCHLRGVHLSERRQARVDDVFDLDACSQGAGAGVHGAM